MKRWVPLSTNFSFVRGFTLLEMVITVSIIGILAAIVAPTYMQSQAQAELVVSQSNLLSMKTGFSNFFFQSVFDGRIGEYVPEPPDNKVTHSWANSTTLYDGSTVAQLFSGDKVIYNPNDNPYEYYLLPGDEGFRVVDSDFNLEMVFSP